GLFVKSLDNRPGICAHSYAGDKATDQDNRDKLLAELSWKDHREAYFLTVICFRYDDGKAYYLEEKLNGTLATYQSRDRSLGYDKNFYVDKHDKSVAQMEINFKNKISHRGLAMKEFKKFLEEKYENFNN